MKKKLVLFFSAILISNSFAMHQAKQAASVSQLNGALKALWDVVFHNKTESSFTFNDNNYKIMKKYAGTPGKTPDYLLKLSKPSRGLVGEPNYYLMEVTD